MSNAKGRWAHVPIVDLFQEAGIPLKPRRGGAEYSGGHPHRHDSKSGTCLVVWPESARWYCSSCRAKGDAADFLVDTGQADTRDTAKQILTARFGPPQTHEEFHLTDLGNARRLASTYGDQLRYCWPWNKWMVWSGKYWHVDTQGRIFYLAKEVVKAIYGEAAALAQRAAQSEEEDTRVRLAKGSEAMIKWAKHSESRERINAMVDLARSEPAIPVNPEDLDANPWLLNAANGTLDLRTGKLLPHDPSHLITKLIKVPFHPEAPCPTWKAFLHRIMQGQESLIQFLQRMIGYALTGEVYEQVLFILYGTGSNGKSTFINTWLDLLGDYAVKATSELLMTKGGESHPTERTRLFGTRFVTTVETEANQRLAEAFIKELTGGDPITARRMKEDFWTFWPTHKVLLATNHKPVIRGTDHAIWRRPKLIPFTVTIPDGEQDKSRRPSSRTNSPASWPGRFGAVKSGKIAA